MISRPDTNEPSAIETMMATPRTPLAMEGPHAIGAMCLRTACDWCDVFENGMRLVRCV
jgi:hypothetical protein